MGSPVLASEQRRTMSAGLNISICLLSLIITTSVFSSIVQRKESRQSDTFSRPQVDQGEELTILESCEGVADGTRCTKRCIHISCDPLQARCYKGHCKRGGFHPCITNHPCCCGDCNKQMEDPENTQCFQQIQNLMKKTKTKKNKKKTNRKKNKNV